MSADEMPTHRTTRTRKQAATPRTRKQAKRYWSSDVTLRSNALDLEPGVFTRTPRQIAASLKRSAERSRRRKASPFRSAMSMLTFYENRAGKNLSQAQKHKIRRAKDELRRLYGRARAQPQCVYFKSSDHRRSRRMIRPPRRSK